MELKKTATSIFIVPTLKINRDDMFDNNCINGYIKDLRRDVQYENAVYLLFKPENIDRFREFLENEYIRTKNLIDDYDYENGFVVLVYTLDKKWKKDFALIREGLYSQTSQEFQELFPKVLKIMKRGLHKDELSMQFRIFKKDDYLREYWEEKIGCSLPEDAEVWPVFQLEEETLDLDKIKQEELV
jgi:hypothetical protein